MLIYVFIKVGNGESLPSSVAHKKHGHWILTLSFIWVIKEWITLYSLPSLEEITDMSADFNFGWIWLYLRWRSDIRNSNCNCPDFWNKEILPAKVWGIMWVNFYYSVLLDKNNKRNFGKNLLADFFLLEFWIPISPLDERTSQLGLDKEEVDMGLLRPGPEANGRGTGFWL